MHLVAFTFLSPFYVLLLRVHKTRGAQETGHRRRIRSDFFSPRRNMTKFSVEMTHRRFSRCLHLGHEKYRENCYEIKGHFPDIFWSRSCLTLHFRPICCRSRRSEFQVRRFVGTETCVVAIRMLHSALQRTHLCYSPIVLHSFTFSSSISKRQDFSGCCELDRH